MEFNITRENKMVREAIRDWVSKECPRDKIKDWDAADRYPATLTKKLSRLGFCAMTVAEEHGGEGVNIGGACIVAEEIAARFQPLARWYTHQALMGGFLIETLGSDAQKAALLPDCANGRRLISPMGIADFQAPMPTCRKDAAAPGAYLLRGESAFVSLADQADVFLVPTASDAETVTLFLVTADRKTIEVTPVEKIGCRGARCCRVVLDDVPAHESDIIDGGATAWQRVIDIARLMTAAESLGLARGAFDYTLDHVRQRVQFGQAIGKFAAVRNRFAEMACAIDAAAMLVARAAWCADNGMAFHREAAVALLNAADIALCCAMEGLQFYGGYGYTMEYDIQRYVRDAAGLAAAAGGEEAAKERIGSLLGL
jgi:alkylation response protein AidB-like acyl-CoA dehydrogenase